jgi:Protein of unknown function (DUF3311)
MFDASGSRRGDDELSSLQTVPKSPPPAEPGRRRPGPDQSRWHWLLAVAVVVPLLTPLYNRVQPRLFGLPFFYWSQMAFIGLAACVTMAVYQATKRRGS